MAYQCRQGAIFAMEEIGHKVAGRPVKLIIEDEASDPAIAMDRARKLVESDKVCMLVQALSFWVCCGSSRICYQNPDATNRNIRMALGMMHR